MAALESAVLSHADGVSDGARARELYKYFQPTPLAPVLENAEASTQHAAAPEPGPNVRPKATAIQPAPEAQGPSSSPDTALTAFCQLVAWRTGVERVFISVLDGTTHYIIAESSKTLDLVDKTKHAPGDGLKLGCSSGTKEGRVCERTIALPPTTNGEYPYLIVGDMSKDDTFKKLPFVEGYPYMKYYAGVPLITKRGIPIGTLAALDEQADRELTQDHLQFMGTMAATIMRHLEMVREVEEHRRGMKMSRGLASFVEGRSELIEADVEVEEGYASQLPSSDLGVGLGFSKSKASSVHSQRSTSHLEQKERAYSAALSRSQQAMLAASPAISPQVASPGSPSLGSTTPVSPPIDNRMIVRTLSEPKPHAPGSPGPDAEASAMKVLFSRAANLIREAFEVDGGAVFYDAQRGFNTYNQKLHPPHGASRDESQTSGTEDIASPVDASDSETTTRPRRRSSLTLPPVEESDPGEGIFSRSSTDSTKPVELLGFSTSAGSSIHDDPYPGTHHFIPFSEKSLHSLIRRYPRGKLWTFDTDGFVSSSSEDDNRLSGAIPNAREASRRRMRSDRIKADARFLQRHFPGVRQLLFVPLWDASRSRWLSGCFAWSTEPTRILSRQGELAFLTAFGNSVMAEVSRMDTEIANQKKGDFIGSISHELRSPLHGILASAEFLGEEVKTSFEKGLVETIDSCGRTLLDTINHILDFSKINHFEQNWRKSKRGRMRSIPHIGSHGSLPQSDLPMINLFADIDISTVCEEVVEGVFAGHVFQNVTAQSFNMVPGARDKMLDPSMLAPPTSDTELKLMHTQPDVSVIFDIDVDNYHFITQPGAFRRVIMNLLGNALKYTSHGYVHITLETEDMESLLTPGNTDATPRSMVTLTITDTGKGISSEFLRSKLFTPFAQENSLSSGTGLGLAIVRSIVALLEGNITFESELGSGTQVKVSLPLLRELPKNTDSTGSRSNVSVTRDYDDSVPMLRARVVGQKVSLCGFDTDSRDTLKNKTAQLLKASIQNFLSNWYGMEVVPLGQNPDIIVANEANLPTILKLARVARGREKKPNVLVLCSHASRFDRTLSQNYTNGHLAFVAKPVGPVKLARALLQSLEGDGPSLTPAIRTDSSTAVNESSDLSRVFEEISLNPRGGEVLDNSRMAAVSANARKAIESPTPSATMEKGQEFPFPTDDKPYVSKTETGSRRGSPLASPNLPKHPQPSAGVDPLKRSRPPSPRRRSASITAPADASGSSASTYTPTFLIVDDNKINLTLLRTYMHKQQYKFVDEAENGFDAVEKVRERIEKGQPNYDIIFMDISMPVLDGFGATRQIRALEEQMRKKLSKSPLPSPGAAGPKALAKEARGRESHNPHSDAPSKPKLPAPALVIALTGLASSSDQTEAFSSGIDLFLTKPVSFKEVGKLLENWEANRERDESERVDPKAS